MPFPSAFMNSDWEDNDLERDYGYDPNNLGEVREAGKATDFRDQPQGHTGAHQCGQPAWYVQGLPSNPAGVPVTYNADGLPVCCAPGRGLLWGRAPVAPRGGIAWGGLTPEMINATDNCFGSPEIDFGVLYQQTPRLMGAPGTAVWVQTALNFAPRTLTIHDLGGANTVSGVAVWVGPNCFSISFVNGASGADIVIPLTLLSGQRYMIAVLPTTAGAGVACPVFTIEVD